MKYRQIQETGKPQGLSNTILKKWGSGLKHTTLMYYLPTRYIETNLFTVSTTLVSLRHSQTELSLGSNR